MLILHILKGFKSLLLLLLSIQDYKGCFIAIIWVLLNQFIQHTDLFSQFEHVNLRLLKASFELLFPMTTFKDFGSMIARQGFKLFDCLFVVVSKSLKFNKFTL